jgi:hypothetical protein
MLGIAIEFAGFGLVILLLVIVSTVFWFWMLFDCLANRRLESIEKLVWVLVIFFGHLLGAILYYVIAKNRSI